MSTVCFELLAFSSRCNSSCTVSLDDIKFLQRLGKRIRKRREKRGLTQQQLGDQCELHITFVGSGERNVSILNLRLMASVLRVDLCDLFQGCNPFSRIQLTGERRTHVELRLGRGS